MDDSTRLQVESLHETARRQQARWQWAAARDTLRRAVRVTQEADQSDGISLLSTERMLAEVLRELGDLREAERLASSLVPRCERLLGPGHPGTVRARAVLATIAYDLGDRDTAHGLCRQVLDSGKGTDGPAARAVLLTQANLARLYRDRGEPELALSTLRAAHSTFRRRYGDEDLDTLRMAADLAELHLASGDRPTARQLLTRAHHRVRALLGAGHPFTVRLEERLAAVEPPMPTPPEPEGARRRRRWRRTESGQPLVPAEPSYVPPTEPLPEPRPAEPPPESRRSEPPPESQPAERRTGYRTALLQRLADRRMARLRRLARQRLTRRRLARQRVTQALPQDPLAQRALDQQALDQQALMQRALAQQELARETLAGRDEPPRHTQQPQYNQPSQYPRQPQPVQQPRRAQQPHRAARPRFIERPITEQPADRPTTRPPETSTWPARFQPGPPRGGTRPQRRLHGALRRHKNPLLAAALAVVAVAVVSAMVVETPAAVRGLRRAGQSLRFHTPAPTPTAPGVPTGLTLADHGGSITVDWDDPSHGTATFVVSMSRNGDPSGAVVTLAQGTTSYTATALDPSSEYCFLVALLAPDATSARPASICTATRRPTARPATASPTPR